MLALNKVDALPGKEIAKIARKLAKAAGTEPMLLSGAGGQGVPDVLDRLVETIGPVVGPEKTEGEEKAWSPI